MSTALYFTHALVVDEGEQWSLRSLLDNFVSFGYLSDYSRLTSICAIGLLHHPYTKPRRLRVHMDWR